MNADNFSTTLACGCDIGNIGKFYIPGVFFSDPKCTFSVTSLGSEILAIFNR